MTHIKKSDQEFIDEIRRLFETVPELPITDEETERVLKKRADLLQSAAVFSFDEYLRQYDTLKEYGVEDGVMSRLEFFIRIELEECKDEFLKSEFYQRFKDHKIVSRAVGDFE